MKRNVMIYPSGANNAKEVYYAIKDNVHINVIPASGKEDISKLIYEHKVIPLPYVQESEFINELNESIKAYKIDFIIPTHDTVALYLAKNRNEINCEIITSSYETNKICRFKKKTYDYFHGSDFCPDIFFDKVPENKFPVFSKPDVGEGSKGTSLVKDKETFNRLKERKDLIFLEYLPGKEYTIDCFTDRFGELKFVGPRERVEVSMGISFRSRPVNDRGPFEEIAVKINKKIKLRGIWFFQLKEDKEGKLKLLEISTRTPGTIGLYRHLGVNLPLLAVFDAMNFDVSILENDYDIELFRLTKNKFWYSFEYQNIYIDLDDTLIVDNQVNLDVIAFIYQCKNLKKNVILISKHEFILEETLERYKISELLFDKLIIVPRNKEKSEFINPDSAIFIDNWYKERLEVSKIHKIPVFDVDMVNSLLVQCL